MPLLKVYLERLHDRLLRISALQKASFQINYILFTIKGVKLIPENFWVQNLEKNNACTETNDTSKKLWYLPSFLELETLRAWHYQEGTTPTYRSKTFFAPRGSIQGYYYWIILSTFLGCTTHVALDSLISLNFSRCLYGQIVLHWAAATLKGLVEFQNKKF